MLKKKKKKSLQPTTLTDDDSILTPVRRQKNPSSIYRALDVLPLSLPAVKRKPSHPLRGSTLCFFFRWMETVCEPTGEKKNYHGHALHLLLQKRVGFFKKNSARISQECSCKLLQQQWSLGRPPTRALSTTTGCPTAQKHTISLFFFLFCFSSESAPTNDLQTGRNPAARPPREEPRAESAAFVWAEVEIMQTHVSIFFFLLCFIFFSPSDLGCNIISIHGRISALFSRSSEAVNHISPRSEFSVYSVKSPAPV